MREMGKAMMGTGEATGDRRAILAAEAAIANPLLDEVSMKGARGLLISITGGNDLTLYEVDEAASRIRQEVDEDANIILGATFDENLDGVVRVSVVATGIDQPAEMRDGGLASAEVRYAAMNERLRTVPTRPVEAPAARSQKPAIADPYPMPQQPVASAQSPFAEPVADYDEPPMPAARPQTTTGFSRGLQVQPVAMQPAAVVEPQPVAPEPDPYDSRPFIPPVPESPTVRAARMPQIEDLPRPAQAQYRAQRAEMPPEPQHEVRRRTLLERLAAFGMSRHDDPVGEAERPARSMTQLPAPRGSQPNAVHAEYAKRPQSAPTVRAPQQQPLDMHGRIQPARVVSEEDQLEIPAFLRRQSS
jgi:cell division protein FtsZ